MGFGGRGAYLHTVTAIPCQTVLGMRSVAKLGTHASAEAAASLRALARPPPPPIENTNLLLIRQSERDEEEASSTAAEANLPAQTQI